MELRIFFPAFAASDAIFSLVYGGICDIQMNSCLEDGAQKDSCEVMLCAALKCCEPLLSGLTVDIIILLFFSFVMSLIAFLIDFRIIARLNILGKKPSYSEEMDEDVKRELDYINNNPIEDIKAQFNVIAKEITKHSLRGRAKVNGLTFMVKQSECFGLVGINGAGKSTAIQMMTGETSLGHGQCWVNGSNIRTQITKIRKDIGYCPQSAALMERLDVVTTIRIFSLIRGIPRKEHKAFSEEMAQQFDLGEDLKTKIKDLSNAERKKLSSGVCLLGSPAVYFLDEPTTGMDPNTKRSFWNIVTKLKSSGKTIIIATPNMDECEALCTRVVVMRKGNIQCLGATQRLRGRFAKGYLITLKLRKPKNEDEVLDTSNAENFMQQRFPSAVLKDKQENFLNYIMEKTDLKWSQLFEVLENGKRQLDLEDYSIGQPRLEQVFLKISMNPNDLNDQPDEEKKRWFFC